jgi:hypothetical protein
MALDKERVGKAIKKAPRELVGFGPALTVWAKTGNYDSELITSQAANDRMVGQCGIQAFRNGLESRIAGKVPERVVDLFEVIDINIEQTQWLTSPASTRDRTLQKVLKLHAVGDLGQCVNAGKIANTLFGAASLGNVLCRVDSIR